jgi:hypothetical protein
MQDFQGSIPAKRQPGQRIPDWSIFKFAQEVAHFMGGRPTALSSDHANF